MKFIKCVRHFELMKEPLSLVFNIETAFVFDLTIMELSTKTTNNFTFVET